MSSITPIRNPQKDHLVTPENSVLIVIDYQPIQINSINSMDRNDLVRNICALSEMAKGFNIPIILSTVNVATGRNKETVKALKTILNDEYSFDRTSINAWEDYEFLEAVKTNRDTSHIPVILLSAKASVDDRVKGLEYGADDYIAKPFNSAYLKARIESLIKQRSSLSAYYLRQPLKNLGKTANKQPDVPLEQILETVPAFNRTFIQEVIRFVDENLQNPDFKIDDLAETMNMSRAVFYRKIKTFTGASPIDLVKEMRLKRALELLDTSSYSLSEVAYQSGFSSPQYFSRVFKEQMQCTPNEYKRRKALI